MSLLVRKRGAARASGVTRTYHRPPMTRATAGRTSDRLLAALLALAVLRAIVPPRVAPWMPAWVVLAALGAVALARAITLRRAVADASWHRDPGVFAMVALLAVLLAGLLGHSERVVSDGIDHYVYLRSLRMAGDLDLADDYAAVSPLGRSSAGDTPL